MMRSKLLNRALLIGAALCLGYIVHIRTVETLPHVKKEYEAWLEQYEQDVLSGKERDVKVTVSVKSRNVDRTWSITSPEEDVAGRNLPLRVLQLIREGDLLELSGSSEEFVIVDVSASKFHKKAIFPWKTLQENLPAANLLVLLETVRSDEATTVTTEKKTKDENQG